MSAQQAVHGALTFETVPDWYRQSAGWFADGADVVVDLAGVARTDSAGLALLIEWLRQARTMHCRLRYIHAPEQLQSLTRINGLQDALFPSTP